MQTLQAGLSIARLDRLGKSLQALRLLIEPGTSQLQALAPKNPLQRVHASIVAKRALPA